MHASLPRDALRAGYDRSAPTYDARFGELQRPKHAAVLARIPVAERARVLDVGCGTGLLARQLGHARVTGVDVSPGMLAIARRWLQPVEADARALPFRDASFDLAFAVTSLLLEERELPRALLELRRVVVPGGRAAITLLSDEAPVELPRALGACGLLTLGSSFECGQDVGWIVTRA